jgi:CheY-like chemotaxis protein
MGHKEVMPAAIEAVDETFLDVLRHALNHLYNPELLRSSPLLSLFGIEGNFPATTKLQHILLDAIRAMRPPANEPAGSMRRRIHQVLQLRYEQQFAQKEVAVQLGLSVRQYRRLQHVAVEALAFQLLEQYDLAARVANLHSVRAPGAAAAADATGLPESLQWILSLPPAETTELAQALPELLRLVEPLATRNNKHVTVCSDCSPAMASIHPLIFRQAMLHLLNGAILHTSGRTIEVKTIGDRWQVEVTVRASGGRSPGEGIVAGKLPKDDIVQQMLQACHASLAVCDEGEAWQATLTFDCAEELLVLVIDDHAESTELLQRYVEGTRYRVVACQDPTRALALVQEYHPALILLDVMMPDVDGWEVLSRLKQHEASASIPVWVCTVLDQSELALSLGAGGFLRKPVTRQLLLAALGAQSAHQEPALH